MSEKVTGTQLNNLKSPRGLLRLIRRMRAGFGVETGVKSL
jgi:hypothetical protein